jgi:hypothetical protein
MRQVEIAITGSGSFATEVLHALARQTTDVLDVALVARDLDRLSQLARSAAEIAASVGGRLRVVPVILDWSDDALISRTVRELRPRVIVHTASLQSPWTLSGSDRWSTLIKTVGFGFTLPLQAALAMKIARAIADESPATSLVNACYPDAVNPVLAANGLPVTGGLGNVAILAAVLWDGLEPSMKEGKQLRMIGHHAHFGAFNEGREVEPAVKAWLDEVPIHDVAEQWFRNTRLPRNLNDVAGSAAVPMLFALSDRGPSWKGHSPGPLGLLGGYPVIARAGEIEIDLPAEISLEEAKALNLKAGLADGIALNDNGDVELPDSSRAALKEVDPATDHSIPWSAREVEQQAAWMLYLRESLGGS